jgi:hypothetical protein
MSNINTKRKNKRLNTKRGYALDTGALRAASGKSPYKGGKQEAIKNGVIRE